MSLFRAVIDRIDDEHREVVDALATWAKSAYREELAARPSKHVYVSTLPADVIAKVDLLRSSERIVRHLRAGFSGPTRITPLPETDELYLSHYNRDLGGDEGLFARHYDGNLRTVPYGAVVRALIYLRSSGAYEVLLHTSQLRRRCETYDMLLIDFHRELHWVEGAFDPGDGDRILLKCNFLVTPESPAWATSALWALNVGQFYVVKAAMEYSKSPRTLPQRAVGLACNVVRVLNNAHPALPHAAALLGLGVALRALALGLG